MRAYAKTIGARGVSRIFAKRHTKRTRKFFLFRHIDLTSAATHHFANFLLTINGGMRAESTAKYAETYKNFI